MAIQAQQPQPQQSTPFLPEALEPLRCEWFEGINTTTTRAGVNDKQAYWIDGFMPIDQRNLRTLWDVGTAIFTRTDSLTIVFFDFYNLGGTPYMVVFLSNGSVVQVNVNTQARTTILPAGTIVGPNILTVGTSQWGQQYLLIVANQTNGYWVWDGMILYTAGTLAPGVTITNAGQAYTTAPLVQAGGGVGTGAVFAAVVSGGYVTSINIINAGSGYLATDSVTLSFKGGTTTGSGASVTASFSIAMPGSGASLAPDFVVTSDPYYITMSAVSVVAGGSGYSQFTNIQVSGGNVATSPAVVSPVISGGSVASVNILSGGLYYRGYAGPTLTVNDPGNDYISSVSIVAAGTNYSPNTSLSVVGGSSVIQQAALRPFIINGSIVSVQITSGGIYGATTAVTVTISDSATTAIATVKLMPF